VLPKVVVPLITGATVLLGAEYVCAVIVLDVAFTLPKVFVAVTTQVIALAESAATKVYVDELVPMLVAPRFHWYAKVIVGVPVQVPVVDDNTPPKSVDPDITGATVLAGAEYVCAVIMLDVEGAEGPTAFEAVTEQVIAAPESAATNV
jgi:hypothetical protein